MPARDDDAWLDAIAAELGAVPPAEFTAARNARASTEADRDVAARVKAFTKPHVAAWAVTLLAREGQLGDALELSAALREAQDDLDAEELTKLSRQRRALVSALAKQAVDLAKGRGVAVSALAAGEVERTIDAAVRDASAAAAVQSGRLVRPLAADGIDPVDLDGAVSGSLPDGSPPPARTRDDLAERRARKEAERAAREAERESSQAGRELARLDEKLTQARERADLVAERIDGLRADLARLEADAAERLEKITALEDERRAAASVAKDAEKKAERARAALT